MAIYWKYNLHLEISQYDNIGDDDEIGDDANNMIYLCRNLEVWTAYMCVLD